MDFLNKRRKREEEVRGGREGERRRRDWERVERGSKM